MVSQEIAQYLRLFVINHFMVQIKVFLNLLIVFQTYLPTTNQMHATI